MKEPKQPKHSGKSSRPGPFIQRMSRSSAPENEGRPFISRKSAGIVQPKLTVSQPGDRYEQEADRMADRVQRMPALEEAPPMISRMHAGGLTQRKSTVHPERKIGEKNVPETSEELVQRKGAAVVEPEEKPEIQRAAAGNQPAHASDEVARRLQQRKGQGAPLSPAMNDQMGRTFGTDFSDVRLHTDAEAAQMSDDLNAQAFTYGNDIYFNSGKYQPETASGRGLLGHELTHTMQQGEKNIKRAAKGSDKKLDIVKDKFKDELVQELETINASPKGVELAAAHGMIIIDENVSSEDERIQIRLRNLKPKKYLWKYELQIPKPAKAPKPGQRKKEGANQDRIWKDDLREEVKPQLDALIRVHYKGPVEDNNQVFAVTFAKQKSNSNAHFIGRYSEILEKILVPFWDIDGKPRLYDIEHVLDYQILGKEEADKLENLILLEQSYNRSLGGAVSESIAETLDKVVEFYRKKFDGFSEDSTANRRRFAVYIESFKTEGRRPQRLEDWKWYSVDDITNDNPPGNPYKTKKRDRLIDVTLVEDGKIGKDNFVLITSPKKPGVVLSMKPQKDQMVGAFKIDTKTKKDENDVLRLESIYLVHHVKNESGNLPIENAKVDPYESPCELVTDNPIVPDKTYKLSDPGMNKRLALKLSELVTGVKGMSPIEITGEPTLDGFDFSVSGKVIPTISIFKGVDIDFSYRNGDYRISANVPLNKIAANFPKPFEVHACYLSISAGSDEPLSVSGLIGFRLPKIGEGEMEASVTRNGVEFNGDFVFEGDYFNKSSVRFSYKKGAFSFGAELKVGRNKIKGLKSATLNFEYDQGGEDDPGKLLVAGSARPDIKGVEEIAVSLEVEKDGFAIAATVPLNGLVPRLKEGSLTLKVRKGPDGYEVEGGGFAVPDIPGVDNDPRLTISYKNGAILIAGETEFKKGKAKGSIRIGLTNQVMDENNQPTGEIAEEWSLFGGGDISLTLSKDVVAKARADFQPNGDLIVSGEVSVDRSGDIEAKPNDPWKKELFSFSPPEIILFALPIGVSLTLKIKGGAWLYGSLQPPRVEQIILALKDFNLSKPEENTGEIIGTIIIGASGNAGFALSLSLTATLSALVAKVSGTLTGSLGLDAVGKATAELTASWSPASGLELRESLISLEAKAQFLAKLEGSIRVYLDLWLAEIDIFEESIEIASIRFGPELAIGMKLPISMEDGRLKLGELNKNAFEYPDVTSPSKQSELVEQAAKQDEKLKPPPPPSKEEAIAAVRRLRSGSTDWDIVFREERGDEFFSTKNLADWNLISRDTYVAWLRHQHDAIDWSDVATISRERDQKDYEKLKNRLADRSGREQLPLPWRRLAVDGLIDDFIDDHFLFIRDNIANLRALRQEWHKIERNGGRRAVEAGNDQVDPSLV